MWFDWGDCPGIAAAGYCGAGRVDSPFAIDVLLSLFEEASGDVRMAAGEHGVAGLVVAVLLQRDGGWPGVELEGVLALTAKRGVVTHQRPIAGENRLLLLLHALGEVVAVGDAVAVGDDEGGTIVGLGLLEGLDGLGVAARPWRRGRRRPNRS